MPNNFENPNTSPRTNEDVGEKTPRSTYEERGNKTYRSELEARERGLLERRARILEELAALGRDIEQTAPIAPETSEQVPEPESPETITPEEARATAEKAKKKSKAKQVIRTAAAIALAAAIGIGGFIAGRKSFNQSKQAPTTPTEQTQQVEDTSRAETQEVEDASLVGESMEAEKGIYDGYGEKGMWLSESKTGKYNFAFAPEVAEVCDGDEVEMIKYTARNQVESFADYMANLPEQLQPEGFKGLNILETEAKLESLSDEDFDAVKAQFDNIMDSAYTRKANLNGTYQNSYMRQIDPASVVAHGNMELVECTTNENNITVEEFFWMDENGNEIGSMTVKIIYDDAGNIVSGCLQVVNPTGTKDIYSGMPSVEDVPDATIVIPGVPDTPINIPNQPSTPDPTPTPTTTPTPTSTPEWGKTGDPHSGENRLPSDLVNPTSEVTQAENDATNEANQGYVDDNKATPGVGSENSGINEETGFADSGIIAEGANTDGGRYQGGENQAVNEQGESQMAGENAYNPPAQVEQGRQTDVAGNSAQERAQTTGNTGAGEDNYSDTGEVSAVAEGDF